MKSEKLTGGGNVQSLVLMRKKNLLRVVKGGEAVLRVISVIGASRDNFAWQYCMYLIPFSGEKSKAKAKIMMCFGEVEGDLSLHA